MQRAWVTANKGSSGRAARALDGPFALRNSRLLQESPRGNQRPDASWTRFPRLPDRLQAGTGKGEYGLLPSSSFGSSNVGSNGKIFSVSVTEKRSVKSPSQSESHGLSSATHVPFLRICYWREGGKMRPENRIFPLRERNVSS